MRRVMFVCLALGLLLAACDASKGTDNESDTASGNDPASTETAVNSATPTASPTSTATTDPTATPEPTTTPEPSPTNTSQSVPSESATPTVITATLPEDCIDINTASAKELREIIHIDEERSQAILDLRPFSSIDDLERVNGIANERLQDIRQQGIACASPQ